LYPKLGQYETSREGLFLMRRMTTIPAPLKASPPYKKSYGDKQGYYRKQYEVVLKTVAHCPLMEQLAALVAVPIIKR
jgi:hypothetical protein